MTKTEKRIYRTQIRPDVHEPEDTREIPPDRRCPGRPREGHTFIRGVCGGCGQRKEK